MGMGLFVAHRLGRFGQNLMLLQPFDRTKHVYRNEAFVELVKDAVRFFSGTPVHPLPPPERFLGTGVYALYCTGRTGV